MLFFLFGRTVSRIQLSIPASCAGPNTILNAPMYMVLSVGLYYKEFGIFVLSDKIRAIVQFTINQRNCFLTFFISSGVLRVLYLWFCSAWPTVLLIHKLQRAIMATKWHAPLLIGTEVESTKSATRTPTWSSASKFATLLACLIGSRTIRRSMMLQ